jgi:hypothetical protein
VLDSPLLRPADAWVRPPGLHAGSYLSRAPWPPGPDFPRRRRRKGTTQSLLLCRVKTLSEDRAAVAARGCPALHLPRMLGNLVSSLGRTGRRPRRGRAADAPNTPPSPVWRHGTMGPLGHRGPRGGRLGTTARLAGRGRQRPHAVTGRGSLSSHHVDRGLQPAPPNLGWRSPRALRWESWPKACEGTMSSTAAHHPDRLSPFLPPPRRLRRLRNVSFAHCERSPRDLRTAAPPPAHGLNCINRRSPPPPRSPSLGSARDRLSVGQTTSPAEHKRCSRGTMRTLPSMTRVEPIEHGENGCCVDSPLSVPYHVSHRLNESHAGRACHRRVT